MNKVKICGLKNISEAKWVADAGADFAGMVVFFPKSKRNISVETAKELIAELRAGNEAGSRIGRGNTIQIKSVAVTVEPADEQIAEIEAAGFDYLQYHGALSEEKLDKINIPVIKAFNVKDVSDIKRFFAHPKVAGFVFDANNPGSGMEFDYSVLDDVQKEIEEAEAGGKFVLLAGGLGPDNVERALEITGFKGADTSSGVENENGDGKDREKIYQFVANVKGRENR